MRVNHAALLGVIIFVVLAQYGRETFLVQPSPARSYHPILSVASNATPTLIQLAPTHHPDDPHPQVSVAPSLVHHVPSEDNISGDLAQLPIDEVPTANAPGGVPAKPHTYPLDTNMACWAQEYKVEPSIPPHWFPEEAHPKDEAMDCQRKGNMWSIDCRVLNKSTILGAGCRYVHVFELHVVCF